MEIMPTTTMQQDNKARNTGSRFIVQILYVDLSAGGGFRMPVTFRQDTVSKLTAHQDE